MRAVLVRRVATAVAKLPGAIVPGKTLAGVEPVRMPAGIAAVKLLAATDPEARAPTDLEARAVTGPEEQTPAIVAGQVLTSRMAAAASH
jgi:hypothetical protein